MSDWITHDGMGLPVPPGTMVTITFRNGRTSGPYPAWTEKIDWLGRIRTAKATDPFWGGWGWALPRNSTPSRFHILAYRIETPAAFEQLKRLAEAPEKVPA